MKIRFNLTLIPLAFAALFIMTSCDDDDDTPDPIELSNFNEIAVTGDAVVELTFAGIQNVELAGGTSLDEVELEVNGDRLEITPTGSGDEPTIRIEHPSIRALDAGGNAVIYLESAFPSSANEFDITARDAARVLSDNELSSSVVNIELRNAAAVAIEVIQSVRLNVDMFDGARCNLDGFARTQNINLTNGCQFNLDFPVSGYDFSDPVEADSVWVTVDNGGQAWVYPRFYLNATASTGSRIFYKGDPVTIIDDITGGSDLESMD